MKVPQLQINDLTNVETIYDSQIHTISIRRKEPFNCEKHDFQILDSPQKNFEVLTQIFEYLDDDQEHFIILVFNADFTLTGYKVLFAGKMHGVYIDHAVLFRNALLLGASDIVIAHNHNQKELKASSEDIDSTQRLKQSGVLLNVDIRDHIIFNRTGYISMRQQGHI